MCKAKRENTNKDKREKAKREKAKREKAKREKAKRYATNLAVLFIFYRFYFFIKDYAKVLIKPYSKVGIVLVMIWFYSVMNSWLRHSFITQKIES